MSGDETESRKPSVRVEDARRRASERRRRQRALMRPLASLAIGVVIMPAVLAHPAPGGSGSGLAVAAALVAYSVGIVLALVRDRAGAAFLVGAAGIALAALQPHGLVEVAPSIAVFIGVRRLPLRPAALFTAAVIVGLDIAIASGGVHVGPSVVASTLLCLLLAVPAVHPARPATESQDRASCCSPSSRTRAKQSARGGGRRARPDRERAARRARAFALRRRDPAQGARKLAEREHASPVLSEAIDRASELRQGRPGERPPGGRRAAGRRAADGGRASRRSSRGFRADIELDVDARGSRARHATLPADPSLALYRGAQEALTNVARYAPGARTTVALRYESDRTSTVESTTASASTPPLEGVGGGHGLRAARADRAGRRHDAGRPDRDGWRVELEVPA